MIPRRTIPRHLSPVRLTGGKAEAQKILHEHLPPNFEEYREPFFGAGSIGLSLMWLNKDAKYWINDADRGTFCFWSNLRKSPAKMQKWVMEKKKRHTTLDACRELFNWCRDNMGTASDFEAGCMWFIQNRISFNGHGVFTDNSHFTDESIAKLKWRGELLQSVDLTITNYDYSVLLGSGGRNTVVFLDPPYDLGSTSYYGRLHKEFDHDVFSLLLRESPLKWMLTYNDHPNVRRRFEGFTTKPLTMTYKKQKLSTVGRELLITNYGNPAASVEHDQVSVDFFPQSETESLAA